MNISDLDFGNDKYIGEAILFIMGFFMYVWLTSSASPITFNIPHKANIASLVSHLEVILIIVIPLTLLGMVQSLRGGVRTRSSAYAQRLTLRAQNYQRAHSRHNGRYAPVQKEDEEMVEREKI